MIVTTYTCDRCAHTQEKPEQMWQIALSRKHMFSSADMSHEQLWCRACMEVFRLLPAHVVAKADLPAVVPTLEDLIRDIVRTELEA